MKRHLLVLLGTASSLAACSGGTGAQTVGSTAPPPPISATPSATPTPTPAATNDIYTQFATPTEAKSYKGLGGSQVFDYLTDSRVAAGQQGQRYAGNATTVRDSSITITYDPRDAIFTLSVTDPRSAASTATRFQDPGSRTDFANSTKPQWGAPDLAALPAGATANANVRYLQAGDGDPLSPYGFGGSGLVDPGTNKNAPNGAVGSSYTATSFFFEKPGTSTKYVTFAGYVRNSVSFGQGSIAGPNNTTQTITTNTWHLERGAFAYGAQTLNAAVPTTGTGTYNGSVLATMIYNPTLDDASPMPSYFQWLTGTSTLTVDFGAKTVGLAVNGFVLDPQLDRFTSPQIATLLAGSTFSGTGSGSIDLVGKGGFTGAFSAFSFVNKGTAAPIKVDIAGSSIDGTFFGPKAEEAGGGFRVVGGTPDQRIDVLGTFTGKK